MAILKLPVVIDGVKCIEELANRVLDEYEYHGRTIREWADLISKIPPHGDLIDRDALIECLATLLQFPSNLVNGQWIVNTLREQPAIIPAEEGEA